ncbi:MAG: hypothetical protein MR316_01500, partial [Lachnospiraceae bacterium]|nr:hypothetical protein [Lachnospiraceae bacterium]
MGYKKIVYNLINWINRSQGLSTPLGAALLNKMDKGIKSVADGLDAAYTDLDSAKLDKIAASKVLAKMPSWDPDTGVLTFNFIDSTSMSIDLNVEKIPVSFSMDKNGVITMATEDGTKWFANVGDVIPDYAFNNGDRIAFSKVQNDDGSYTIKADVVKNSITADCLQPNFLADVVTNANAASASAVSASGSATNAAADAKLAQSYSVGGSGVRDGESTDNAKYYAAQAEKYKSSAATSESNSKTSETNAKVSERNSAASESNSKTSETNAKASERNSATSENNAKTSETNASKSATSASASATSASGSATNAASNAKLAQSYSVGGSGVRDGENTDNAKYYAAKAKEIQELVGASAKVATETANGLMSSTDKKNLEDLLDPYNRNMLADGTDFHEVTKPGSYQFHHTKTYINNPPMVNGFVDVKTYGNIVKQIAYRQGTIG